MTAFGDRCFMLDSGSGSGMTNEKHRVVMKDGGLCIVDGKECIISVYRSVINFRG